MQLRTWCGLSANLSFELREFPTELTNAVFIERAPLPWAVCQMYGSYANSVSVGI